MIRPLAYAQAKRWKGSVGSPEIQGFIGGLQLEGVPKTQGEDSLNIDFMPRIARRKSKNGISCNAARHKYKARESRPLVSLENEKIISAIRRHVISRDNWQ